MIDEVFMTTAEVAAKLQVSRQQVWNLCAAGELGHTRIGRRAVRIGEGDLRAYLDARRRGPVATPSPVQPAGEPVEAPAAGETDTGPAASKRKRGKR